MAYSYSIFSPSGNITALVHVDSIPSADIKKQINDELMGNNPDIEQVGFEIHRRLEMAGGEFCANACRAAVYLWLEGKPGSISFKCSGDPNELVGTIYEDGQVEVSGIRILRVNDNRVNLHGITHFLYKDCKNREEIASFVINENQDLSSVGVIFYDEASITPCVWVKAIGTTFWEQSCASGTIAYCAFRGDGRYSIKQPSGASLTVQIKDGECKVKGVVSKL